jgi:hypothetical protein
MRVKIIENKEKPNDGVIVWDCFRGSYTYLFPTIANLIECKVITKIDGTDVTYYLHFNFYETDGLQSSTRQVVGDSVLNRIYCIDIIDEEIIVNHFEKAKKEYFSEHRLKSKRR